MPSVINEQLVARWSDPKYQVLSSLVLEQLVRPLTNEELRLLDPLKISTQLDGQKWLLDLRGLRYTGKTFKKASWKNSSVFEWAVLDGSCFVACSFEELHIQWSSLRGCSFEQSRFLRSSITGCDCSEANFRNTVFEETICRQNDFTSTEFIGSRTSADGTEFDSSIFIGSQFDGNENNFINRVGSKVILGIDDPFLEKVKRTISYAPLTLQSWRIG
jgi:uncharacterized protein YjbI with pentapeptide repeats